MTGRYTNRHTALFFSFRRKNVLYFAHPTLFSLSHLRYNIPIPDLEVLAMTVRERLLAIRLLEKQEKNPDRSQRLGIQVTIKKTPPHKNRKDCHYV